MEQRTEEWYNIRATRFTASDIVDICAASKDGITAGMITKAMSKAVEHFLGVEEQPEYLPEAMQRGVDNEPFAFKKFAELKALEFLDVSECGFYEDGLNSGSSPDGIVSNNSVLEIKCPNRETFFKLVATEEISKKYMFQMQKQMHDTKTNQCYFFNYYIHEGEELWHEIIVKRDEEIINLIQSRIKIGSELRDSYIAQISKNKQF